MADPQIPKPVTYQSDTTPEPTRINGPDMMAMARGRQSVEEHAKELAAQARVTELERNLAETTAILAELQVTASKAAVVGQAQQHELALVDRKHALELARTHQQWALDDARKARDRQLVEADRQLIAAAEAQHIAEVRCQCDAISKQNNELHAAIARENNRIEIASVAYGLAIGAVAGGGVAMWSHQQRKGTARGAGVGFVGVGGLLTAAVPIVAQHFKPAASQLPTPITPAGWDAYLLAKTADNEGLRSQIATLRATTISWSTVATVAAGVGAITYGAAG